MNLSHLRYFAAVVEHGNVTRAAELLYVAQPTVSAALRTVEREIGQALFDRVGRRLRVTAAGAEAYRRVVRILAEWDDARATLRPESTRVRLRIGALDTLPHRWLSDLLSSLQRARPYLVTTLRTGAATRLVTWLAARRIDVALTGVAGPAPGARVVWREPFVAMFHPEHRLARRQSIALRDVSGEPFVQRDHCEIMDSGRERVRQAGVRLTIAARVRADDLALTLVENGLGYTLAPLSLATAKVMSVPVDDFPIQRSVVLQIRDGATSELTSLVEHLLDSTRRPGTRAGSEDQRHAVAEMDTSQPGR
ncbi:MAG: LysR family transcriptional regulator [Natronosporangium sp.]